MKQAKPIKGMPGINSAFAVPHIDKVLAIDDGILPNAGRGQNIWRIATLLKAKKNNIFKSLKIGEQLWFCSATGASALVPTMFLIIAKTSSEIECA